MKQFAKVAFVAFLALTEAGRVKRAALNNCQTNPSDMDEENSVDDGATFSMSCSTDTKVLTCIWRHTDPISEKNQGSSAGPTILCSGGTDSNGRQCSTDTRLTFRTSENTCAIDISNSKPEDTGRWILTAVTLNSNGLQTQEFEKRFEVYTFNQSLVEIMDEDFTPETSIDTTYNYDTKEEEWVSGKGGWESVEFSCMAYGGRPRPEFRWFIGNNDNMDLTNVDHFSVSTSAIGSDFDYIENYQSTIEFAIDDNLLQILEDEGVDTNPSNGRFTFDVECEVMQGNQLTQNGNNMRINVDRPYDDGNLKGSMIGVIVGVVLAVILLIVAVALLVFAKATSRWCFADDYDNPSNAKSHPRSQVGGGGARPANQQAQRQHR